MIANSSVAMKFKAASYTYMYKCIYSVCMYIHVRNYVLYMLLRSQTDESMLHKPLSADSTSTACRSKTPTSCMSSLHLRPQISVKLPAISMKKVQKNPDQLTIEDLPAIRSQVLYIIIIIVYTERHS